jgi:hypothetical protein
MSSPADAPEPAPPDPQVVRREPPVEPRPPRPESYPRGPESRLEPRGFGKRNSDPAPAAAARPRTQVKPFTKESLERLERKTVQLVREYGFQPRRKLSVEDGSRLPAKFEPFPAKLYGRPLEEIDNFIYDEVGDGPRCCGQFLSGQFPLLINTWCGYYVDVVYINKHQYYTGF